MASQPTDVRLLLSEELKDIRSKIVDGKLVLFVGEQVSALVSPENPRPSLDDWWKIVDDAEVRTRRDSAIVDILLLLLGFFFRRLEFAFYFQIFLIGSWANAFKIA